MLSALIVLLIFALVVGRCAASCCQVTDRSHWYLRRRQERTQGDRVGRTAPPRPAERASLPAERAETPLEALQRRFASGDMSVEQYEREVGRIYGIRN